MYAFETVTLPVERESETISVTVCASARVAHSGQCRGHVMHKKN